MMIKTILCMLLIIELCQREMMVTGEVYKVGDSAGWTAISNTDYGFWASSKTFHVNDVLLFEYNTTNNNVIEVTHSDFRSCNTSAPMKTFNSGNDSFTIKSPGHYYFTSNFSDHCQAGQKVDIRVLKTPPVTTTPPSTTQSPIPSKVAAAPVEVNAPAPSPSSGNVAAARDPMWLLMSTISMTISGFVFLGRGCA